MINSTNMVNIQNQADCCGCKADISKVPSLERDSNFELLRIVSIFMITIHHLVINGWNVCGYNQTYNIETDGISGVVTNSFCIIGVNLFVLISGYWGIRHVAKGCIKLILYCIVIGLLLYFVKILLEGYAFNVKEMVGLMRIKNWWFVSNYMVLCLLSPIIEKCIGSMKIKDYELSIFLLTLVNVGMGYCMCIQNKDGYNYMNFIYLYFLGRYIRMMPERHPKVFAIVQRYSLWFYILVSMILAIGFLVATGLSPTIKSTRYFAYNNPLIIISSMLFFISFMKLKYKSHMINTMACGVFGVYLLQSNKVISPLRDSLLREYFLGRYQLGGVIFMGVFMMSIFLLISIPLNTIINRVIKQVFKYENKGRI